ncbi:CCC2 [Candida jiufengensis]|uniref:CCC2 n=1 Tax=Candida jiufengensis TaxID=497108 RepID=UPI0022254491|nr:CCC2 [Candida jiufengensis]KAI5956484.1 CCC2 [Candida jiufengensis]
MSTQDEVIYKLSNKPKEEDLNKIKNIFNTNYKNLITYRINNQDLYIRSDQLNNINELQILKELEDIGLTNIQICSSTIPTIQTSVSIQGMTCGACSASITESLESQPGITKASISLVTENGSITHSKNFPLDQIISIIEDCGFDAQLNKIPHSILKPTTTKLLQTTIGISGMTCGACSSSITNALENLEGVTYVSVSLITEEALVKHTSLISTSQLKEVIEDCGFDVTSIRSVDIDDNFSSSNEDNIEEEEVNLKIVGIHSEMDLHDLKYNIEALIQSFPGIKDYNLTLLGNDLKESAQDLIIENDNDVKELTSELNFIYDSKSIGIRDIVDGLNNINDDIEFFVFNSVDQSSASQLNLLSKVKDIKYWTNIFLQSLILGVPVIILVHTEKTQFWKNLVIFKGLYVVTLIELVISTYVQFHLGQTFIKKFASFLRKNFKGASMDVLVCISTMVTYIFSLTSIILSVWNGRTENPPKVLFDTLVMLVCFVSFGKLLENKAKGATSTALSSLLSLTPSMCTIIDDPMNYSSSDSENEKSNKFTQDFKTRNISIDLVQPNDVAIVLPGGKVPADGVLVFGESEIDESLITGEPLPVYKSKGDPVIGGSMNGPHLIHMKVTKTGKKSQLHQIINLVKESQVNKAPVQRFSDYIAARFVPSVMLLSIITFIIWSIICYNIHPDGLPMIFKSNENGKLFVCLQIAISVVVVACPCALGLAAPTAVMVGTGVGALNGVLIKGADILEKTTSINIILFDKTGTLTTGEMSLVQYKAELKESELTESDWWKLIGSVECNSEHPVGKALTKSAKSKLGLTFEEDTFDTDIESLNVLIGSGIEATITIKSRKYDVNIGNIKMIGDRFENLLPEINHSSSSNTVVYVVIDDKYSGLVELSDSLKEGSREVIEYLRNVEGYIIGMVTGDNKGSALKIGKEVGIFEENIFYEVSPIHKDKVITELKERYGSNAGIAFIGDGINDAPALAKADVGMAISSGTDIAIESADIVLIGNNKHNQTDLHGVINALKISNKTFARIKLNFIWAVIYNLFMLPFAMGCFLPFNLMLPPVAASIAMMISSISVVLSSLQLKWWKPPIIHEKKSMSDLENGEIINDFNLKNGSIEEFSRFKRKSKIWNFNWKFNRRGRTRLTTRNQNYELVSGNF